MGNSQSTGQISAAPTSAAGATALPPPPVLAPAAAPPAPTAPAPAPGDRAPAPPPPPGTVNNGPAMTAVATPPPQQELPPPPPESGPGTFEDLHKVTKGERQDTAVSQPDLDLDVQALSPWRRGSGSCCVQIECSLSDMTQRHVV